MTQARILIVEDERIVATDLRQRLTSVGYTVVGMAATGDEAIRMVEETSPDLVLMDITLKGDMDGVQAATAILGRCEIPVLYLTANADSGTLERAKTTGPFGYILKPSTSLRLTGNSARANAGSRQPSEASGTRSLSPTGTGISPS
jgi:CheY-like chemotaxis protein